MTRAVSMPLDDVEERAWRALMRLVITLPRALDDDLERSGGLSMSDYGALMHLSEAPRHSLRMSELAARVALSPSRMTRLIADLEERGWVSRRRDALDGRGNVATLTPAGLARLEQAWPHHLASVRTRFLDALGDQDLEALGDALVRMSAALERDCASRAEAPA